MNLRDQSSGNLAILVDGLQRFHRRLVDLLKVTKDRLDQVLFHIVLFGSIPRGGKETGE